MRVNIKQTTWNTSAATHKAWVNQNSWYKQWENAP